jgi:hypothetical protein
VLRGRDTHRHWGEDRWPEKDWDPICLEELDRIWAMYQTPPEAGKTSPDSIQLFEPFTNLLTRPVSTGRRNYPVKQTLIVDRVTWRCTVLLS